MTQNAILYGIEGQEHLDCDLDDLIERLVEIGHNEWPVEVLEFRRTDVKRHAKRLAYLALDEMLEALDEEHMDPDGNPTEPTESMKAAARVFAQAVVAEYVSWNCEPTGNVIKVEKPKDA